MTSVPAVPEFRDADQCRQHGVEILRPKPRRLGDLSRSSQASPHDLRMPAEGAASSSPSAGTSHLKALHRDMVGGSAPSLSKFSGRELSLCPTPSKVLPLVLGYGR